MISTQRRNHEVSLLERSMPEQRYNDTNDGRRLLKISRRHRWLNAPIVLHFDHSLLHMCSKFKYIDVSSCGVLLPAVLFQCSAGVFHFRFPFCDEFKSA